MPAHTAYAGPSAKVRRLMVMSQMLSSAAMTAIVLAMGRVNPSDCFNSPEKRISKAPDRQINAHAAITEGCE